jgi:hypothetical protein
MGEHDRKTTLRWTISANHSSEPEKLATFGANRAPQNAPIGWLHVCAASKQHARLVRGELRDNHLEMPNGRVCKINFLFPEAGGGPSFYYVTRLQVEGNAAGVPVPQLPLFLLSLPSLPAKKVQGGSVMPI